MGEGWEGQTRQHQLPNNILETLNWTSGLDLPRTEKVKFLTLIRDCDPEVCTDR